MGPAIFLQAGGPNFCAGVSAIHASVPTVEPATAALCADHGFTLTMVGIQRRLEHADEPFLNGIPV